MIMINPEENLEAILEIAKEACIAARTSPKANGLDSIVTAVIFGDEVNLLSSEMKRLGGEKGLQFYIRDADNILGHVIILVGTKLKEKVYEFSAVTSEETNVYVTSGVDLGIAIGSIVSLLADKRIDNRVMLSIGKAAVNLKILGEDVKLAFGIPLSVSGKNPYFDRR